MAKNVFKMQNEKVTTDILAVRTQRTLNMGYAKPKWIEFCEALMAEGYRLEMYEAKNTVSKYITVSSSKLFHRRTKTKPFKVRFSNHKPIEYLEIKGTCNFFVGVTHLGTTNWRMAVKAVQEYYKKAKTEAVWVSGLKVSESTDNRG